MPRRTFNDGDGDVYRVIVNATGQYTGSEYEVVYGPYGTLSAAKGVLTCELSQPYRREATGHIERAVTVWEVVE